MAAPTETRGSGSLSDESGNGGGRSPSEGGQTPSSNPPGGSGGSPSTVGGGTPGSSSRTGGQCLSISPRPAYCFRVTAYPDDGDGEANPVLYTYEYLEEHCWEFYELGEFTHDFYVREICAYVASSRSYRCGRGNLWFPRQGPFDYYRERPQGTPGTNFAYWAAQLATELSNADNSAWWVLYDDLPAEGRSGQGDFPSTHLGSMVRNLNNDRTSGNTYYYLAQRCDRSRGCGEIRVFMRPDGQVTPENLAEVLALLPLGR